MKYPTSEQIIEINKLSLEKIKTKKADKHQVASYSKIDKVLNICKDLKGDIYDKAGCLLKGLIQNHPFESGNRRTAFIVTKEFLIDNNFVLKVENSGKEARTLIGIREGYYSDNEIKNWLKIGKIRKFKRFEDD